MTIQRYEIFNKVVAIENITKAGEELNLTQSTVSHAIKSLEDELGFRLLVRNRSGINLTREGEKFYEYTRKIINMNNILFEEAAALVGMETGCIKVGTFSSVTTNWMPTIFKAFKQSYPGISIEFVEDDFDGLEDRVIAGELDCCFTTKPANKNIEFISLKKDPLYCIVSKASPLHKQKKIKMSQLEEYPLIQPEVGWDNEIHELFQRHHIEPNMKYKISDDHSIFALVEANIGISIRPGLVLKHYWHQIIPLEFEKEAYRIIGIAHTDQASPATKSFINKVIDLYQNVE
ncbi:LysR family transcriptional regulator [Oceanobacillus alkalisoli]|uniref:LysR family transcriptional regulator n=1 Tax=Oceanobacillus alkalisoli TaxID=2925113 RepID=UPI001EE4983D|nr:LysR family transcriptional regulator [Oceanobacillus alkalisoli]